MTQEGMFPMSAAISEMDVFLRVTKWLQQWLVADFVYAAQIRGENLAPMRGGGGCGALKPSTSLEEYISQKGMAYSMAKKEKHISLDTMDKKP